MADHLAPGNGAHVLGHRGAEGTGVTLRRLGIGTAWNVQGDASDPSFAGVARAAFGLPLPSAANSSSQSEDWIALWIGRQSWLLIARPALAAPLPGVFLGRRDALNAAAGALFDVSAGRVAFEISGAGAAAILNKTCPLDLHPNAFPVAACAQSVMGHIAVLLYKIDATPTFVTMLARSMAGDAWSALCAAAAATGYDVLASGTLDAASPIAP